MSRQFIFVGVTTGQSSIVRIFPRWRPLLGLREDVELTGCDLPIGAAPERYREVVRAIKEDPAKLGALVTTHKIDLYRAAGDLFDELEDHARLMEEISSISKRGDRLRGGAKDAVAAGRALDRMLGPDYFAGAGTEVLCLGSGGAARAITTHLLTRPRQADRPARVVATDRDPERLAGIEALHRKLASPVPVEYLLSRDPRQNDRLVSELPPRSLVINATGMGKDTPGSPLTGEARFPEGGIAWELNYRGALDFLHQAWGQRESRDLRVEDGWRLFLLGWTTVMEDVFDRPVSDQELEVLAEAAAFARPDVPTAQNSG
jgi:shikimate 5-dehydrogenase